MGYGRSRHVRILAAALLTLYGFYVLVTVVEDPSDFNRVIYPKRLNFTGAESRQVNDDGQYTAYLLPKLEDYYQERAVKWRSQLFAADVFEPYTITNTNFWVFFPAINAWCPHQIERIGGIKWNWKRRGEGGKWICGLNLLEQSTHYQHSCIVYSYGIEDDTSFESALLARTNCSIYMFDPTIDGGRPSVKRLLQRYPSRANFFRVGLGPENFKGEQFSYRTLRSEMKQNRHTFVDILKIDIEGDEFVTFENILEDFSRNGLPFGQLQIEFHVPSLHYERNLILWNTFRGFYEMLEKVGLRAFMAEPNPISSTKPHDNVKYYEYAFINVRSNHFILSNYTKQLY